MSLRMLQKARLSSPSTVWPMKNSSSTADAGDTQLYRKMSRPQAQQQKQQQSSSLASADITPSQVNDDDSEWEYEYSTTETETFYVTLDLSTQDFTDKRTKTIHHGRGGYQGEKRATLIQSRRRSVDSGGPGSKRNSVAVASDGEDDQPQNANGELPLDAATEKWRNRRESDGSADEQTDDVQIMELHSSNPVISYQGRVYAGQWQQNIGTEFLLTKHNKDSHLPVLRHLENGVDLLAASSARISVAQKELRHKDEQRRVGAGLGPTETSEAGDSLVPPTDPGASKERIDQGNFLRDFIALKRAKGETDKVPVLVSTEHLRKRAPTKKNKDGRGRGRQRGGTRLRGRGGKSLVDVSAGPASMESSEAMDTTEAGLSMSTSTPAQWSNGPGATQEDTQNEAEGDDVEMGATGDA